MTKLEIAKILKASREKAGLTQQQAADSIKRKRQTLASWETGKSQPDADTLFELFDTYGISVNEAFGYTKKSPTTAKAEAGDLTPDKIELLYDYDLLNENGKEAARNAIHGLTSIPDYKKSSESKFLEKNA